MEIMLSTDSIVEKYLKTALENPDTPFTYNDTKFINIKRLYEFIKENFKSSFVVFEEVIKEVIQSAMNDTPYELGSWQTKSGHAEVLYFDYTYEIDEETGDVLNATISFR